MERKTKKKTKKRGGEGKGVGRREYGYCICQCEIIGKPDSHTLACGCDGGVKELSVVRAVFV